MIGASMGLTPGRPRLPVFARYFARISTAVGAAENVGDGEAFGMNGLAFGVDNGAPGTSVTRQRRYDRWLFQCTPGGGAGFSGVAVGNLGGLDFILRQKSLANSGVTVALKPHNAVSIAVELARLAAGAGAKTLDSGMWIAPSTGIGITIPSASGTFFGFVADGAGGWQIAGRGTVKAGLDIQQAIAIPDVTVPHVFEIRIQDATPTRDAIVSWFVDRVMVRQDLNMALYPQLSTGIVNSAGWDFRIRDTGANAQALQIFEVLERRGFAL